MSVGGRWWVAGASLGLVVAALAVSSAGGEQRPAARAAHSAAPNLLMARFGGDGVQGVVYAVRHPRTRRAHLGISLHGLTPGSTYEVVGVPAGCARDVDITDSSTNTPLPFRSTITPQGGDFVSFAPVRVRRGLGRVESVRVYEREQEAEVTQRACARDAVFIGGGAATGAIIGS